MTDEGLIDYDDVRRKAREHRPKLVLAGYSAYSRVDRLRGVRRRGASEIGAVFMVDMAHFAGLVAAGVYPSPVPHADVVTTTTHKTLRGPRGGLILCKAEHAKAIDKSVFPGSQGGPLEHIIAAKAVCFKEALDPSFKTYAQSVVANARALAAALASRGFEIVSGGTDNHLMLVDLRNRGTHRQGRAVGARRGGDHGEQEHRAERNAVAVRDERHSYRNAGGDDARHGRARDGADRRADRPRAGSARG